jgi:ABC-2 type transport system permease protein
VNWEHFKAILWLRWRLSCNQWRRAGKVNLILMMIFVAGMLIVGVGSFFVALVAGVLLLPIATPLQILLAWDGLASVFLVTWLLTLLIEIQRSEMLSLDNLLQFPVSLKSAFILNYLTSLVSISVACFLPAALGLSLASVYTFGPSLLLLPIGACIFLFMVTMLTYQLRGWLASMMSNKRRQRSIVAGITLAFVAMTQLPNVFIQLSLRRTNLEQPVRQQQWDELAGKLSRREITIEEHQRLANDLTVKLEMLRLEEKARKSQLLESYVLTANQLLPVGWLPYAGKALVEGKIAAATLALFGMVCIGGLSLWRGYSATIRYYTGATSNKVQDSTASERTNKPVAVAVQMERRLPFLSEQAATVALCGFHNLVRAPEAKMMLIAPLIFGVMMLTSLLTKNLPKIPLGAEPYLMFGGLGVVMFIAMTLVSNSFGFDRHGFRSFVLMPVERRDLLIGKNASVVPFVAVMSVFELATTAFIAPVGIAGFIASVLQVVVLFLAICLVGNTVSILFPMPMSTGAGKPVQPNLKTVLAQMIAMSIVPLSLVPGAIAISLEFALLHFWNVRSVPVFLMVTIAEVAGAVWLYRNLIGEQAKMLAARETEILQILSAHVE